MKKEARSYLIMGLLAFLLLSLEILVILFGPLSYGTQSFFNIFIPQSTALLINYGIACIIWGVGIYFLYTMAKKRGFNVFENKSIVPMKNWIIVFIIVILFLTIFYFSGNMTFKFVEIFNYYGNQGIYVLIGSIIHTFFSSAVILAIIIFFQEFGELSFKYKNIPWGGIFFIILYGLIFGLSWVMTPYNEYFVLLIRTVILLLIISSVYPLLKKNVIYAYPIITLLFFLYGF